MENNFLEGKRVIFIGQVFYDYHEKIITQLKEFGAIVDFFENKIFKEDPVISKGYIGFIRRLLNSKYKEKYVEQILKNASKYAYDYLLCVGGFSITPELLTKLRKCSPQIKCIIYFWDSFSIWNYKDIYPLFDNSFSFDPVDCEIHSCLTYLPLFYTNEYRVTSELNTDIDLLYVGSVGAATINRCTLLGEIENIARNKSLKTYFWVYYPLEKSLLKVITTKIRLFLSSKNHYLNTVDKFKNTNNSFIKHTTLNRQQIASLLERSKCVIDIPITNQAGLTIRTIETLAMGKKLLTTNRHIEKEFFFNNKMIEVLYNPINIDADFIAAENEKVDLTQLMIGNWVKTLFKGDCV